MSSVKEPAVACIRHEHNYTYCGREAYRGEYVFNDAAYAVKHYANCTFLQACPDCVRNVKAMMGKEQYEGPLATRGLKT